MQLAVPGAHNVANALGAMAVSSLLGIPFETCRAALEQFTNTRRRFEYYAACGRAVRVYHDYGHHPNEIRATLDAASRMPARAALLYTYIYSTATRARARCSPKT